MGCRVYILARDIVCTRNFILEKQQNILSCLKAYEMYPTSFLIFVNELKLLRPKKRQDGLPKKRKPIKGSIAVLFER